MTKSSLSQISLAICKDDADIAKWFNMVEENGQSRSRWVGALLVAYARGEYLPTGNSLPGPPESLPPFISTEQPTEGPFQRKEISRKKTPSWSKRDINGNFTIGSSVFIKLGNKQIVAARQQIQEEGIPLSKIIRAMIRKGFDGSDREYVPDRSFLDAYYATTLPNPANDPLLKRLDQAKPASLPATQTLSLPTVAPAPPPIPAPITTTSLDNPMPAPEVAPPPPAPNPAPPVIQEKPVVEMSEEKEAPQEAVIEEEEAEFSPFLDFI